MLKLIIDIILNLIGFKKAERGPQPLSTPIPMPNPPQEVKMEPKADLEPLNWEDPKAKISQYFTIKEALWLPQWGRMANETDGLTEEVKANLLKTFKKMDVVRSYLGKPITVHVAYRPTEYNKLVKGAPKSAHLEGLAVDFSSNLDSSLNLGQNCDKIRELLNPCLAEWQLRMEDNGKEAPWVHIDLRNTEPRYFKP